MYLTIEKDTLEKILSKYLFEELGISVEVVEMYETYTFDKNDPDAVALKVKDFPQPFVFKEKKLKEIVLQFLENNNMKPKFNIDSFHIFIDLTPVGEFFEGVRIWYRVDSIEFRPTEDSRIDQSP